MKTLWVRWRFGAWLGVIVLGLVLGSIPAAWADPVPLPFDVPVSSWRELYGPRLRYDEGRLVMFGQDPTAATGAIWTLMPHNCGTTGLPACVWTREVPPALTGVTPAFCTQKSFPMPAAAVACVSTSEPVPPAPAPPPPPPVPPAGNAPVAGLTARVWKPIPAGPSGSGSKHTRLIHDSKRGRMVLAGGDGTAGPGTTTTKHVPGGDSYTGQVVFAIDLARSSEWEILHGWCAPPGGVMPPRPDNVTWAYDPKRDQGVMMPAYYGGGVSGCPGITDDPLRRGYAFDLMTNQWGVGPWPTPPSRATTVGWGGDQHNHFGVLDPVTDAVYRFHYVCGAQIVPLDGTPGTCIALSFPHAPVSNAWNLSNDQMAIDMQGRMIYAIARYQRAIVKWSITKRKVVELIPLPATWFQPAGENETLLAFDSKNRVLLHPNTAGYGGLGPGGVPAKIGFYRVDTKTWEWEDAPVGVSGNTLGYDATNNVFLFLGRNAGKQFWLYRYE